VVSVTGYTLGGGLSWFSRAYGWAADSVTAIEGVRADGTSFRVTAGDELFWALRGGGGDYALVTALEFTLHPAPQLYGGRMLWPAERAADVLGTYRTVTAAAPEALTVWFDLLNFPGSAPLVAVDATYLGDPAEGRDLLRPLADLDGLLSDGRRLLSTADLGSITAEPTDPGPGLSRGELLTALDDRAAKTLLAEPIDPLLSVQLRHLGGALARPSDSPHGALEEPYALYLFGVPSSPESAAAVRARQRDLVRDLAPWISGRKPYTYLTPSETAADAFAPDTLARLRAIKHRFDPHHTIRSNYPIPF
jgi:FAD/FMN-containing dehydrogenase